jgi:hypothetical protein
MVADSPGLVPISSIIGGNHCTAAHIAKWQ